MLVVVPVSPLALASPQDRAKVLRALLEPVIMQNRILIRRFGLPSLFAAISPTTGKRIRWQNEPWAGKLDEFALATTVLRRGWGDCDDIVAWRVAELREAGDLKAGVKIALPRPGRNVSHATVRHGDGHVEDPSRELGMGVRY